MVSKIRVLIVTCVLSLFISESVYSSQPESCMLFSITSQNVARIGVVNREKNWLELTIRNEKGEPLFSKSVAGYDKYFKLYDLTDMPEGEYVVRLTGGDKLYERKFTVSNKIADLVQNKKDVRPVFKLTDENILIISYLNAKDNDVNIFFELNEDVVFEERNITGSPISRKYSLKKMPQGDYTVKLYSGGYIYQYPLAVK